MAPPAAAEAPKAPEGNAAAKKKGKTPEEKQKIILGFFHASRSVHVLKDARDACVRAGVPYGDFENQLQALMDDNLVQKEKVGTGSYLVKTELARVADKAAQTTASLEESTAKATAIRTDAALDKVDTPERASLLQDLANAQVTEKDQLARLDRESSDAPEMWEDVRIACLASAAAANRWLDNIELVRQQVKRATGLSPSAEPLARVFEHALGASLGAEECVVHAQLTKPCTAMAS